MGVHARSAETRERILAAAVDLFADLGYDGTTIADITDAAQITTGSFYYHFDSKESLASAVIEEGWPRFFRVVDACTESGFPSLENVIAMTFELMQLLRRDKTVLVGARLDRATRLRGVNQDGRRSRSKAIVDKVATAVSKTNVRDEVGPQIVGQLVWILLHGCDQLSEAMHDDPIARLTQCWEVLLRGIVPADSLQYFEQFLARTSSTYA